MSFAAAAQKRAFDFVAATAGLAILALPLLLIALAVRLTSPGPALFRQLRIGRGGRLFRIWKFRTMADGAGGAAITVDGDPRVTRMGALLRRTKLDELPQLVNVWLGDMSLVGPRPEVPRYLDCYAAADREVLDARPGITDPASIQFRDEEEVLARFSDPERAYREVILPAKLELSREYLRRRSLGRDLVVLWQTFARL